MFSKVTDQGLLTVLGLSNSGSDKTFVACLACSDPGNPLGWMDSQSFLPTELCVPYCNRYGQRHDPLIEKVL